MKNIVLTVFIGLYALGLYAQSKEMTEGNKNYDKLAFKVAIEDYEKAAAKGVKSVELYQKLGNCYYFNGQLKDANKWYAGLFSLDQTIEPEYYFRYSQTLKSIEDYVKANEYLDQFNRLEPKDSRAIKYRKNPNYLPLIQLNSGRYDIGKLEINTEFTDYGASIYDGKLIFTSTRPANGLRNKINEWDNQSFSNLFQASIDEDGNTSDVEKFSKAIATKFHESSPVFTTDGKTMYFTRNNYNNGKKGTDSQKTTLLKIYKATLIDGKWENVTELPFNSNVFNCAHPALSPDQKYLYFSSNRPGGLGNSDIYRVKIISENFYGNPENLGNEINTEGRETFPFVSSRNELFFASDGHLGLGGLDVFVAKFYDDLETPISQAFNLGSPLNSPADDFAYYINNTTKKGYFSSNRDGGLGFDDIYRFVENKELEFLCEQQLTGFVYDKKNNEVLRGVTVTLYDEKEVEIAKTKTDENGKYNFKIACDKKYFVKVSETGFEPYSISIEASKKYGERPIDIYLSKPKIIEINTDLAKEYDLKPIKFDLSKWNIRPDAAVELDKIVKVMQDFPKVKIDVRSHTDSRDTAKRNITLSNNRAKSTMAYIIEKGINANRLTGRGYGESNLVNKCADGVKCTEEEHQQNRRSEFIVTEK